MRGEAGLSALTGRRLVRVDGVVPLTPLAFRLRLECPGMSFTPGQCVILGVPGLRERREYSIYSAVGAPMLDVLIREVEGGVLSRTLRSCRPGDPLELEGPVGYFTLDPDVLVGTRFLFVASGTGIAHFTAW